MRPDGIRIRQAAHFGEISAASCLRPAADSRQGFLVGGLLCSKRIIERKLLAFRPGARQAIAAQIVRASFEKSDARGAADRRGDQRQVLGKELVLQSARAGRDEHASTGKERGHQVGEGFAGAGARLDGQQLAPCERRGNPFSHA